MLSRCTVQR